MFVVGEQVSVSAMSARPALLVVLLLNVITLAHQQSVSTDDYVPAIDEKAKSSTVDVSGLHADVNAIKRHIGKFVRIGRFSSSDRNGSKSKLRSENVFSSWHHPAMVGRLSERVRGSKRQRPDWFNTVDKRTSYDVQPQKADTKSGLLLHASEDSSKKSNRGGNVRFVRIGKADGQLWTPANFKRSDDVNVFRRSLENRFVRIGK